MRPSRSPLLVAVTAIIAVGCSAPAGRSPASSTTTAPIAPDPTAPGRRPSPSTPVTAPAEVPPDAFLAAEGGDPVAGQLGTYTWRDGGSDSPWLPGADLAVGAGEPLTVTLVPEVAIETWVARSVPAGSAGPDGARALGEGRGEPAFRAPEPGAWTVHVQVVFADGLGDANYFWALEVR